MNINRIYLNLRQISSKNYAIFWGGGGRSSKDHIRSQGGRGGGQDGPKKDHIIFERSLLWGHIGCFIIIFKKVSSSFLHLKLFKLKVHKHISMTCSIYCFYNIDDMYASDLN